jgi:hypothetical protein
MPKLYQIENNLDDIHTEVDMEAIQTNDSAIFFKAWIYQLFDAYTYSI